MAPTSADFIHLRRSSSIKRYISIDAKYELRIEIQSNAVTIAADRSRNRRIAKISYRTSKGDTISLTLDQVAAYRDWVTNVLSVISGYQFEIVEDHQANETYSYYIKTKPELYEGFEPEWVYVVFRIADHLNPPSQVPGKDQIIRTILINEEEYTDGSRVIAKIKELCKQIKAGDYSGLLHID